VETELDEHVWQRMLAGDACGFGVIWDRHQGRVYRHLLKTGVATADVEDLTATVFLELWRHRDTARFVDGSVLPWLIVTAQNVARNSFRARVRHRAFLAKLPPPVPAADPADGVVESYSDDRRRLRKMVSALNPTDRELLALTVLEAFTIRDAAAALGLSEAAAKTRLSRLRKRLQNTPVDHLREVEVRQ